MPVTNPDNEFFNLETSKQIMADQIYNGVVKRHQDYWQAQKNRNREKNATTGLNLSYGFRTWGQMKNQYDQINTGQDMIKGLDGTIWNKQKNGTYEHEGEDGLVVYTPNQLKRSL